MNDVAEEYGLKAPRRKKQPQRAAVDRELPQALEAEEGVLGSILQWPNECMGLCVEQFRGKNAFYDLRNQTIYRVLLEMHEKQEAIDVILLVQKLKDKGVLEDVGGFPYVSALPDKTTGPSFLEGYLDIVWEKFLLRSAARALQQALDTVYEFDKAPAEELLLKVESEISALTEANTTIGEEHIKGPLRRVMLELQEHSYRRGSTQLRGLPTGPAGNYLDKILLGIRPTYYVTVAGRPGSGKTSLAMNWVEFWAIDFEWWQELSSEETAALNVCGSPSPRPSPPGEGEVDPALGKSESPRADLYQNTETGKWHRKMKGIPVCVFSIEMDGDSLTERLLFGRAGVTTSEFRQGFAGKDAEPKLVVAFDKLAKSNIYIDATPAQTMGQIAAKARRMVKQYGLKNTPPEVPPMVFVLDYIQLVEEEGGNGMDRVKEITKISRKIMSLKKQLKCPWIVNAQMNRNIETAERDRKPVLSDLKDCGALEQDCDVAVFTYRTPRKELERVPESGGMSQEETIDFVCNKPGAEWPWSQVPYRVDLVVPKNRFGPTGDAQMVFCKNLCRFEDWHLWKARNGAEGLKAGESQRLIDPPDELK